MLFLLLEGGSYHSVYFLEELPAEYLLVGTKIAIAMHMQWFARNTAAAAAAAAAVVVAAAVEAAALTVAE